MFPDAVQHEYFKHEVAELILPYIHVRTYMYMYVHVRMYVCEH